jgi:AAA15 family ATPase/GTPase
LDDIKLDPRNYLDKYSLRLLFDIMSVRLTHGIDFQSFFDLLQSACIEMGLIEQGNDSMDNCVHVDILELFCKNFIRGFSKLIIDLGFDSVLLEEID